MSKSATSAPTCTPEDGAWIAAWCVSQVGVTWQHQGRRFVRPGESPSAGGLDCVGLPICGARARGFKVQDMVTYSETPASADLLQCVSANCVRIWSLLEGLPGDLLLFWIKQPLEPRHAMVDVGGGRVVHARRWMGDGRVVMDELDGGWIHRLHSRWRLRAERRVHG